MKIQIFILAFFICSSSTTLLAQTIYCSPLSGGTIAGNSPPGCRLCSTNYFGNTAGYTPISLGTAGFPCGVVENNQFLSVIVDDSGVLEVSVLISDCELGRGVELIIYDQSFNPVSNCARSAGTTNTGTAIAEQLIPGDIYWIMIDGMGRDICDFSLQISGSVTDLPIGTTTQIRDDRAHRILTPGSVICFETDLVQNVRSYSWEFPNNLEVISQTDLSICLRYNEIGCSKVRINLSNNCISDFLETDEIIIVQEPSQIPRINMCKGGAVVLGDSTFTTPGLKTVTFQNENTDSCGLVVAYEITEVDSPEISMSGGDSVPCRGICFPLEAMLLSQGNFEFQWTSNDGTFGAGTNTFSTLACTPGIYRLDILDNNKNNLCYTEMRLDRKDGLPPKPVPFQWDSTICIPSVNSYKIQTLIPGDVPTWSVTNGVLLNGQGTNEAQIRWFSDDITKDGEICVEIENECGVGETFCQSTKLVPIPSSDFFVESQVCQGDLFRLRYTDLDQSDLNFDWDFDSLEILSGERTGPFDLIAPNIRDYEVTLKVSRSSCFSSSTNNISVINSGKRVGMDCYADWDSIVFNLTDLPNDSTDILFEVISEQPGIRIDSQYIIKNLSPNELVFLEVTVFPPDCRALTSSTSCFSLDCPYVFIIVPSDIPTYFCDGETGSYSLDPNLVFGAGSRGDGTVFYEGPAINQDGIFNIEDLPFEKVELTAVYNEDYCFYRNSITVERIDTTPPIIECYPDSFLQAIAFNWEDTQADSYHIYINSNFIQQQTHTSYLHPVTESGEEVLFAFYSVDQSGCTFPQAITTCTGPIYTNSNEYFLENAIQIIPNPSSGIFKIESDFKIEKIEVFAPSGKKVLEENSEQIDLTGFPKGVYFFKIKSKDFTLTKRGILF